MTSIAFLGLGAMGSRMARRLLDAGHELTVYNRTRERAAPLGEAGARVADTPADAARGAELVVTMLANPDALRAVMGDVARGVEPGATVIDMSTVGPDAVRELPGLLPEGVAVLDAPVLGSLGEAESGRLKVFVGGPDDAVERWRPVLEVLGPVLHAGPLGAGAAAKLVANSALLGVLGVLGEAVALGDGLGLSRDATLEVVAATPVGPQAERRAPVLAGDDTPATRFRLALARKDGDLVVDAARARGLELRLAPAARDWFAAAEAAGRGDEDYSLVLRTIAPGR
jgi:3-hydroxyisobutyrate dehydrogenase-like beta-hydroxyacid dehydrogenase